MSSRRRPKFWLRGARAAFVRLIAVIFHPLLSFAIRRSNTNTHVPARVDKILSQLLLDISGCEVAGVLHGILPGQLGCQFVLKNATPFRFGLSLKGILRSILRGEQQYKCPSLCPVLWGWASA